MPPIKKSKEIFREQIRWRNSELIGILSYLDNNFDLWYKNHLSACTKAIEATNIVRDAKAVYNKVHSLMKAMREYTVTGKKSKSCNIIWDNDKIRDLVENIYNKTKEKKKTDKNNASDDESEMSSDTSTIRTENGQVHQHTLFSTEAVNNLYLEKCKHVNQLRTKLTEKIEDANNLFEKSNVQIVYSTDDANSVCNEKIHQITELRSELLSTIEKINNKFEEMKSFQ